MRSTEIADRPFPNGEFSCRDIGDRWRSSIEEGTEFELDV
jgi:hypothetical protein